jgi:WD40 repeat protein
MPTWCLPDDGRLNEPVTRRAAARRAAPALLLILLFTSPRLRAQNGASVKSPPAPAARPRLELQIGQTGAVYEVAFSPDGAWVASAGGDAIKLWDVPTGTLRRTLTGHRGIVYSVALSPDGKTLASGGEDTTVRLWDAQTGAVRRTLTGHTAGVRAVAFSPDGKLVASAGADAAVKLWDAQTGALLRTLTGSAPVLSLAFSADGQTLVTGERGSAVKLWDVPAGALRRKLTLTGRTPLGRSVALSPDGKMLASGGGDARRSGEVVLWDAQTGAVRRRLTGHMTPVISVTFAPDGTTLAIRQQPPVIILVLLRSGVTSAFTRA